MQSYSGFVLREKSTSGLTQRPTPFMSILGHHLVHVAVRYLSAFLCSLTPPVYSQQITSKLCSCTSALCKEKYQAHFRKHACQRCPYGPKVQQSPMYPSSPPQTRHTKLQHPPHMLPFTYCYID